jgi:hypothetical protein
MILDSEIGGLGVVDRVFLSLFKKAFIKPT